MWNPSAVWTAVPADSSRASTVSSIGRCTTTEEATVGIFGKVVKSGIAIKAIQVVKREASKPENQRKAKEMLAKLRDKRGHTR